MRFSRQSWHHRVGRVFNDSGPPENLCPYFWWALAGALKLLVAFTAGLGLTVALANCAVGAVMVIVGVAVHGAGFLQVPEPGVAMRFGLLALLVLGFLLALWLLKRFWLLSIWGLKTAAHRTSRGPDEEPDSLVASRLKAWHSKVCPRIEWIE